MPFLIYFFVGFLVLFFAVPFDVFPELPHFFIAIYNHLLSLTLHETKRYNEITNSSVKPFPLHRAHSSS